MPEITDAQRSALEKVGNITVDNMPARIQRRRTARAYYEGEHATQLTARQREYLSIKTGQEFNDNYCPAVVDALQERLIVTGFTVTGTSEKTADLVRLKISEWCKDNRFDQLQRDVHLAAIRDADAYVLVEWDQTRGAPAFFFELAANGEEGAEVEYRNRRTVRGWKRWDDRVNLYYPDKVEKFIMREGSWELYTDEGPAVMPWLGALPLIHFKNRSQGYNYGTSELTDVIPLQNALNKSIIDLVASADTTGFRIFWMTGDDPGQLDVVPGSWVYTVKPEAKMGIFPGEDLSGLIGYKDAFVTEIARVSRTPLSYFQMTGQVAAEGTLKQQESGLIARALDRSVAFGNSWEDVMLTAIKVWNTYGGEDKLPEDVKIEAQWRDPETRNGPEHMSELKSKRELGIPYETIWAEAGYTADQIKSMKASEEYRLMRIKNLYETANAAGLEPGTLARMMGWDEKEIAELYGGMEAWDERQEEQDAEEEAGAASPAAAGRSKKPRSSGTMRP